MLPGSAIRSYEEHLILRILVCFIVGADWCFVSHRDRPSDNVNHNMLQWARRGTRTHRQS
jgi:hypothetical protein